MSNKNRKKPRRRFVTNLATNQRFIAMSKRIGIFVSILMLIVIGFAMFEMHYQNNLDSLSQLIISIFSIGIAYIGFYLTMAKWEHIEAEKTEREKDILKLKKELGICETENDKQCQLEQLQQEVNDLKEKADYLLSETDHINNY